MGAISRSRPFKLTAITLAILALILSVAEAKGVSSEHGERPVNIGQSHALPTAVVTASPIASRHDSSLPPLPRLETELAVQNGARSLQMGDLKTTRTADGRLALADRILVGFDPEVDTQTRQVVHTRARERGAGAAQPVGRVGMSAEAVDVAGAASLEAAIARYRADPRVRYAEPDYVYQLSSKSDGRAPRPRVQLPLDLLSLLTVPNDPHYHLQWGLETIEAPAAWDISTGSSSVVVAVLDTGIYEAGSTERGPGHPDLNGKVLASQDFTDSIYGTDDAHGHGSHVAGIIAASTNNEIGIAGVGYDTSLLNVKVLDDRGNGAVSTIANGIYWATDQGAKVINLSLGSANPCPDTYQDAINYAWEHDVVVVAAAGNDGADVSFRPANCEHVLAVAATTSSDTRADFSNYGVWVDVAAPGLEIYSTKFDGNYGAMSGTSQAAPHVSGLAALIWSTSLGTDAEAVVTRIKATAEQVPGTGTLWESGRINARAALTQPTPTATPTSTPTAIPTSTATTTAVSSVTATPTATPTSTSTPASPTAEPTSQPIPGPTERLYLPAILNVHGT